MRSKAIVLAAVLSLALAAASCGDDDSDDASAKTTTTTTATDDTTTTTASDGGDPGDLSSGPNYVTTSGPSGSGCTPGEVDQLPTGWWAGSIKKVYESGVDLDLVCWYQGDAATAEAAKHGEIATDDYYVTDDNPRTFKVEFPPGMTGSSCIDQNGQRFACQLNDVLQLYRVSLDQEVPTSMLGSSELVAFDTIWLHVSGQDGDYAYMQFTP